MITRGFRNANPGNIRHSRDLWQGEAPDQLDDNFITFLAPEWGLRAIGKIVLNYQKHGLDTVRKMINRWAPPNENNTVAYVDGVADEMGVHPDAVLDLKNDPHELWLLIAAIVHHENGSQPYDDVTIAKAVALAIRT